MLRRASRSSADGAAPSHHPLFCRAPVLHPPIQARFHFLETGDNDVTFP